MGVIKSTTNWIGDRLGYDRCPVTGDSFILGNFYFISELGVGFLEKAYKKYNPQEIVAKLLEEARKNSKSLEGIVQKVTDDIKARAEYLGYIPKELSSSQ